MCTSFKRGAAFAGLLFLAAPLHAGWWIFGKATGKPELLKVYVAGVEANAGTIGPEGFILFTENLQDGRLQIKGFFRPAPGAPVAQARLSLDGGGVWMKSALLEKDSFLFSIPVPPEGFLFTPLKLELIDTKGRKNDPGEVPRIQLNYRGVSGVSEVKDALERLATSYSSRQFRAFTALLSLDFQGDRGSLEDAVAQDFRAFRQINLDIVPQQFLLMGRDALVTFKYNLAVIQASDGSVGKAGGQAAYTLRFERSYFHLLKMPPPRVFGVSAPADENPAAGSTGGVAAGNGTPGAGRASRPRLASNVIQGTGYVDTANGYKFSTQGNAAAAPGAVDIGALFDGQAQALYVLLYSNNGTGALRDLGASALEDNIGTVSASGSAGDLLAETGHTYVVLTDSGRYALIQLTTVNASSQTIYFRYYYQPDGTGRFGE